MKTRNIWFLSFGIYATCLYISPYIYAHVVDLEYIGPEKRYDLDRREFEALHGPGYVSFNEWSVEQDRRHQSFSNWLGDELTYCFDPWYEGRGYEPNERVSD